MRHVIAIKAKGTKKDLLCRPNFHFHVRFRSWHWPPIFLLIGYIVLMALSVDTNSTHPHPQLALTPPRTAPPLLAAVRKGWRYPLHPFLLDSQPFLTYLTPVKLSCNERRQKPNPPFLSLSKIKHVIICSYSQTCFISSKKILFHILL